MTAPRSPGTPRRISRIYDRTKGLMAFEMTWAPDGRATFESGTPRGAGAQVTWRRIGRHAIFRRP